MKTSTSPADFVRSAEYARDRAGKYALDAREARDRITHNMKPGPASAHLVAVIDSAVSAADRADRAEEAARQVRATGGTPDQIRAAEEAEFRGRAFARLAGHSARDAVAAAFHVAFPVA